MRAYRLYLILLMALVCASAFAQSGRRVAVMADANGVIVLPENLDLAGSGIATTADVSMESGPLFPNYFTWTITQSFVGTPDNVTTNVQMDRLIRVTEYNAADTQYDVAFPYRKTSVEMASVTLAVDDEDIASVDGTTISRVSTGTVTLTGTLGDYTRSADLAMATAAGGTNEIIFGGISNSFRRAATDTIDTIILAGGHTNIYTTWNPATTNYVRNPALWGTGLDITSAAAWNSWTTPPDDRRFSGNLISTDIIIGTKHYVTDILVGTVLHYVDTNNVAHVRTVVSKIVHPSHDLYVARLDTPLPADITPLTLLDASTRASHVWSAPNGIPAVWVDRYNTLRVAELSAWYGFRPPLIEERSPYWKQPIGGDSGSPVMLYDAPDAAPILVLYMITTRSGMDVATQIAEITELITELGGDTNITTRSLSEYWTSSPPVPGG